MMYYNYSSFLDHQYIHFMQICKFKGGALRIQSNQQHFVLNFIYFYITFLLEFKGKDKHEGKYQKCRKTMYNKKEY